MPERSALTQTTQVGVETTPGTAVAASKLLQSLGFNASPQPEVDVFRPAGNKFPTVSALGRDWTSFSVEGQPTYGELIYPLSSVLTAGVVTTPDATNSPALRQWTFLPSSLNEDAPKTFTFEQGSSVRAHRAAYGIFTEFTMSFSRESIELGGSVMARALQDGITLTANPTAIPLVPILPSQLSVYLDATSGGLGTTKLLRVLSGVLSITNRYGPLWVVDEAQVSYVTHIELEPVVNLALMVEADAQGMGLLGDLRAGTTRFVRLEANGPVSGATLRQRLRVDVAVKVTEPDDFSDEDGVYAIEFTSRSFHDAGWSRALQVELRNETAAL